MKYIRDDAIKIAFITMINKLIFAHKLILIPYVDAIKNINKDESLKRIQKIQTLLLENAERRETLTKLMAQGYIDQIVYNEESNSITSQSDEYRAEIDFLNKRLRGDTTHITAAIDLLRFTEKNTMLATFDDELFEKTVSNIHVSSRQEIMFVLKCGLKLKERV